VLTRIRKIKAKRKLEHGEKEVKTVDALPTQIHENE
jgi:hypothetical protein